MVENKTKPTNAEDHIASRADEQQYSDCVELMALLKKVTRQTPKMWGPGHRRLRLLPVHLRELTHR
jgi:hypothetical protein